jgi:hypothetical protein
MKSRLRKALLVAGCLLAVLVGAVVWRAGSCNEPAYAGKRLSVWLDELAALNYFKRVDPSTPQVRAVRAIGTNAIPWLLSELRAKEDPWGWRLNMLLAKQRVTKYRFPDINKRLSRATVGFEALGELAEPAIPSLLGLLEELPGFIPGALAGIGPPALPALGQCLTNTRSYATSIGQIVPIPGNTIGAIHNAITAGRLSKSDTAIFLPAIRDWAQSTNRNPGQYNYAANFLRDFDR